MIRELNRNAELRQVCGFNPLLCEDAVPVKDAYYRFFTKLIKYQNIIEEIFHSNVEKRTSTERVFSRIDNMFGFEEHRIFGLKRTQLKVALTMITMTSMAIGYIKSGEEGKIQRYFQTA